MQESSANWTPILQVLMGTFIGGAFSLVGSWIAIKGARDREIYQVQLGKLEKMNELLFTPFLEWYYKAEADDVENISEKDLLLIMREGLKFIVYCPKKLRKKLLELYSCMERDQLMDMSELISKAKEIEEMIGNLITSKELSVGK